MMALKKTFYALCLLILAVVAVSMVAPPELMAQVRAALIRDADQPARQAVTLRKFSSTSILESVYTVPAGKKLVVEQVNCSALGTGDIYVGLFEPAVLTHANVLYSVPLLANVAGVRILEGQTRLYFEPGANINLRIFTTASTTCTISGYTVDAT